MDLTDTRFYLPILCTILSFTIYWITVRSERVQGFFDSRFSPAKAVVGHFLFLKVFGCLILGVLPLFICLFYLPDQSFGITYKEELLVSFFTWTGILVLVIVPLMYVYSKSSENLDFYTRLHAKNWTPRTVVVHLLGWLIYLLGYEVLFRGILLFPLVDSLGIWPAIVINTVIYSGTHLLKSVKESVASIPFGIALCLITIHIEMVWAAFLIHLIFTWTNVITTVIYHPDIKLFLKTRVN